MSITTTVLVPVPTSVYFSYLRSRFVVRKNEIVLHDIILRAVAAIEHTVQATDVEIVLVGNRMSWMKPIELRRDSRWASHTVDDHNHNTGILNVEGNGKCY